MNLNNLSWNLEQILLLFQHLQYISCADIGVRSVNKISN